jgi:hypothetical protein
MVLDFDANTVEFGLRNKKGAFDTAGSYSMLRAALVGPIYPAITTRSAGNNISLLNLTPLSSKYEVHSHVCLGVSVRIVAPLPSSVVNIGASLRGTAATPKAGKSSGFSSASSSMPPPARGKSMSSLTSMQAVPMSTSSLLAGAETKANTWMANVHPSVYTYDTDRIVSIASQDGAGYDSCLPCYGGWHATQCRSFLSTFVG